MPLVAAKCPNCAANLQVNSNSDAAVCEYCKTAFIVEKAINNYNITNNNNIKADVVNIFNNNATDFNILAGTLIKYSGAATKVIIPDVVKVIGDRAFFGCYGLTSVIIPYGVTSIGIEAFSGCSGLTDVIIPNSVTSIGASAFDKCSGLTAMTIQNIQKKFVIAITDFIIQDETLKKYNGAATKVIIPNGVTCIGKYAFEGCTGLNSVIIPESVTSIGKYAFLVCTGLISVIIPESVTSIGEYAFYGCSSLTSVIIPNGVTSIGIYTFYGCSGLTSVVIPNSVTSIDKFAFGECSGLTNVVIPNSVTSIGNGAFWGCSKSNKFVVNGKVKLFPGVGCIMYLLGTFAIVITVVLFL